MRVRTASLAAAAVLTAAGPAAAQLPIPIPVPEPRPAQEAAARLRAYPLKRMSAQTVAPAVAAELRLAGHAARVGFDLPSNSLVVQGATAVHARVAEFLAERDTADAAPCATACPAAPCATACPAAPAPAPRPLPELTAAYRLRNVAAVDAGLAIRHVFSPGREVSITPVAAANEVVVRGSAATHARVAALVADLDREPTMIDISTTMVQVPAGFLRECGLVRPGAADSLWTLTEREAALFSVALRHHPKLTVLSRPQVRVADGQTASVQVGQDVPVVSRVESTPTGPLAHLDYVPTGVSARLTPRLAPSGKAMLLRVEAQQCAPAASPVRLAGGTTFPFNVQTVQTTVTVPTGNTVVLSVPTTGADGKPTAVLYVMTPTVRP